MNGARVNWRTGAASALSGEIQMPGDKSISHRAVMLAGLADGVSRIDGFLEGADTRASADIMCQLGVRIDAPAAGQRIVHGVGMDGLRAASGPLDCGNSGTGMRLLAGVLAGQAFDSMLVGDASLSRRPMRRIADPLHAMGARLELSASGCPPIRIRGGQPLAGMRYQPPVASAQVKSAVLLAGLYARGRTEVEELHPTRDYTERMLEAFAWPVVVSPGRVQLEGGHRLKACDIEVPGDFSSAAFFLVAASIIPGSRLIVRGVGLNPRRTGLLQALLGMGADIRQQNPRQVAGEQIADLEVRHAPLRGIDIPEAWVGDMIDEFPVLFVAAAAARGRTRVRGAAELRVKESDRLAVMAAGLRALGVAVEETPDGADITGKPGGFGAAEIDSHGDHRIAMAFAVAGALAREPLRITDCANVDTSFPGFAELAAGCGLGLRAVVSEA